MLLIMSNGLRVSRKWFNSLKRRTNSHDSGEVLSGAAQLVNRNQNTLRSRQMRSRVIRRAPEIPTVRPSFPSALWHGRPPGWRSSWPNQRASAAGSMTAGDFQNHRWQCLHQERPHRQQANPNRSVRQFPKEHRGMHRGLRPSRMHSAHAAGQAQRSSDAAAVQAGPRPLAGPRSCACTPLPGPHPADL